MERRPGITLSKRIKRKEKRKAPAMVKTVSRGLCIYNNNFFFLKQINFFLKRGDEELRFSNFDRNNVEQQIK
jgi:hypothetical protein